MDTEVIILFIIGAFFGVCAVVLCWPSLRGLRAFLANLGGAVTAGLIMALGYGGVF